MSITMRNGPAIGGPRWGAPFRTLANPEHRAWRLVTLTRSLPEYCLYLARLKTSQYGRIIPKGDPFFDRKFVTPYLATFFTAAQRLKIQSHLCDVLDRAFCPVSFMPHLRDGIVVWRDMQNGDEQTVTLRLPVRTMLEGDLTLDYRLNGEMLYRFSLAFVPGYLLGLADQQVAFIGGSQGVHGTAETARRAAKLNGEINAPAMLMIALRAICRTLDIGTICGVTAACQPVIHDAGDHHVSVYDGLWDKHHGIGRDGYYMMPVEPEESDEVEGANKSRTRRKRRRKQALTDRIAQDFRPYVRNALSAPYLLAAE